MKYARVARGGTDAAYAQRGIRLISVTQKGQRFVGAGVQGAHYHPAASEVRQYVPVGAHLLGDTRRIGSIEKTELGAVETDSFGAAFHSGGDVVAGRDVGEERHAVPVGRTPRMREPLSMWLVTRPHTALLINCWFLDQLAGVAIDEQQGAVCDGSRAAGGNDRWDPVGSSDDRGVGGGSAFLGDDRQTAIRIQFGRVGWCKINCEQNERMSGVGYADTGPAGE